MAELRRRGDPARASFLSDHTTNYNRRPGLRNYQSEIQLSHTEEPKSRIHSASQPQFNSAGSASSSWSKELAHCLQTIWYFLLPKDLADKFFGGKDPQISSEIQAKIDSWKKLVLTPYDSQNPQHERALQSFWKICRPNESLESRSSPQWKTIGFQGVDPATDFRGAGILGLRCLVYFGIKHPETFHKMLAAEHRSSTQESYPFAIAGLNIVMMLFEILGWGFKKLEQNPKARKHLVMNLFQPSDEFLLGTNDAIQVDLLSGTCITSTADDSLKYFGSDLLHFEEDWKPEEHQDDTLFDHPKDSWEYQTFHMFYELFCYCFKLLDREWYSRPNVSYMDFPAVLSSSSQKVQALFAQHENLTNIL